MVSVILKTQISAPKLKLRLRGLLGVSSGADQLR